MRSIFVALPLVGLATSAMAADLPRREPLPVFATAPLFSWSGMYSGIFAGYGRIDNKASPVCTGADGVANGLFCPAVAHQSARAEDFIAGTEIGYNYQFAPGSGIVVGVAGDYQFTPIRSFGTQLTNL